MTKMYKLAITLTALALATLLQPTCVFACKCLPPGPPEDAVAEATAVFSGQVTTVAAPANMGGPEPVQVTFAVAQVWKGAAQPTVVVNTPSSSASCGLEFVAGQEYLVYAQESEGRLQATLCSRTTQLAMASQDLAVLGQGSIPAATSGGVATPATLPATGRDSGANLRLIVLASGALLVIALGAVVVVRRRRVA